MLDKIISLVKGQVQDTVLQDSSVPEEKKDMAVEETTNSIIDSLKDYLTPENISKVTTLFTGGTNTSALNESGIAQGMQSNLINRLTSKVGLSSGAASGIATAIIPAIIGLFTKKVKDDNDPDFNIGSLVSSLTGKKGGNGGGIMDMVGGLFGKK